MTLATRQRGQNLYDTVSLIPKFRTRRGANIYFAFFKIEKFSIFFFGGSLHPKTLLTGPLCIRGLCIAIPAQVVR